MNCKFCDNALPVGGNPRREFCNDAHKQAYWRKIHQDEQQQALLTELEALRAKVSEQDWTIHDQAETISEQTSEISRLRSRLDIEHRYLSDTKRRGFLHWLKKQESPLKDKLLADAFLPTQDTRAHYEYRLRYHHHCDEEELREFARLWKLMLFLQP